MPTSIENLKRLANKLIPAMRFSSVRVGGHIKQTGQELSTIFHFPKCPLFSPLYLTTSTHPRIILFYKKIIKI
jgi:hypothetical protein